MAFLTVGATTLKVTNFRRLPDAHGGGLRRTVNGELRGDRLWSKREWAATVYTADAAGSDAVRALFPLDAPVTLSGNALRGQSVMAYVEVGEAPFIQASGGWYEMLTLTIRET